MPWASPRDTVTHVKRTIVRRGDDVRRIAALFAAIAAMALLAGGLAYAATKVCDTPTCKGSDNRDNLTGTQISNTIYGYQRADTITDIVGPDRDVIYAGRGNDVVNVKEGTTNPNDADHVRCSAGYDTVYYDAGTDTVIDCELENPTSP
jgi:Ca2+-binding RTX toxin-like protein